MRTPTIFPHITAVIRWTILPICASKYTKKYTSNAIDTNSLAEGYRRYEIDRKNRVKSGSKSYFFRSMYELSEQEIIIGTLLEYSKCDQSNSTMHCRLNRLNQTSKITSETRCLCWKCGTVWIESCHSNDWPPQLRLGLCSCHGLKLSERMVFSDFTKAVLKY